MPGVKNRSSGAKKLQFWFPSTSGKILVLVLKTVTALIVMTTIIVSLLNQPVPPSHTSSALVVFLASNVHVPAQVDSVAAADSRSIVKLSTLL